MNKKLSNTIIGCLGLSSAAVIAGPIDEIPVVETKSQSISDFFDFSLSARARYEFREVDGLDASHAGTIRVRPGITLFPNNNLSFFVESEHTQAFIDDFQVGTGQSANFSPFEANNSPIADPETNEINQAYAKLKLKEGAVITAGRQRYILDNAAFVGNVGWRQNEQTLDAVSIKGKHNNLTYSYAFGNRVNRIFGSDATGGVEALEGQFHLLNANYKTDSFTVGGYAYLLDFDQGGFASSNTLGFFTDINHSSGKYHFELAGQTEAGSRPDYDAVYGAANWSKKFGAVSLSAGVEYLGDQFITPLATVHAFNGWADAFIGERLGLTDNLDGLTDINVGLSTKVKDVVLKARAHAFFDDSLSEQYGWEIDAVAVKPISPNAKVLLKASFYFGDDNAPAPVNNDIKQVSLQLDYSF